MNSYYQRKKKLKKKLKETNVKDCTYQFEIVRTYREYKSYHRYSLNQATRIDTVLVISKRLNGRLSLKHCRGRQSK